MEKKKMKRKKAKVSVKGRFQGIPYGQGHLLSDQDSRKLREYYNNNNTT